MKNTQATEQTAAAGAASLGRAWRIFAVMFGFLLGLSLLKFGNPIIMEKYIPLPADGWEFALNPWPARWGYWLLVAVMLPGLAAAQWPKQIPRWLLFLPAVWLVWEFVAETHSVNERLSESVCVHFATCVVCFYLGACTLGRCPELNLFGLGFMAGYCLVLASGFSQHFGGLETMRAYFFTYMYHPEKMYALPPDYLKRMTTNRIFATLFYANTLAGVILMLLPVTLGVIGSAQQRFTAGARWFMMGAITIASFACLYWSGSKGGWLLMLLEALIAGLFLPVPRKLKVALVAIVLAAGLAGFFVKYAAFFRKGATSVVARFDYWEAAARTFRENPVFGSGPGTFGMAYAKIKRPESEMAQLAHNDYLQQASDSGAVGFLAYTGFMVGALVFAGRKLGRGWLKVAVWIGLLCWALQSAVEFGLYIPAVAWPGFALLGWLLAQGSNRIDTGQPAR